MISHAHILDTAHSESYPRELASSQSLLGPVTQSRSVDVRDRRLIERAWRGATPGELFFIDRHHEEHHAKVFTVTLKTGETVHAMYRTGPQITSNRAGYGSCTLTLEQVLSWD